ncbi:MAG: T9SS type A sorting domain-containing protein [Candidatus Paceibacterota bacterium]|jgi:hypothetical protein
MKKIFFILVALFCYKISFAQISVERQVISSTGNLTNVGAIKAFSNVGETVIQTFSQTTLVITQGFEQGNKISATGINLDNISSKNEISIYPNPVGNIINLEFQSDKKEEIKIEMINLLRQVVFSKNLTAQISENNFTLEVNTIPKGVYILQIKGSEIFTKLVIKE